MFREQRSNCNNKLPEMINSFPTMTWLHLTGQTYKVSSLLQSRSSKTSWAYYKIKGFTCAYSPSFSYCSPHQHCKVLKRNFGKHNFQQHFSLAVLIVIFFWCSTLARPKLNDRTLRHNHPMITI